MALLNKKLLSNNIHPLEKYLYQREFLIKDYTTWLMICNNGKKEKINFVVVTRVYSEYTLSTTRE